MSIPKTTILLALTSLTAIAGASHIAVASASIGQIGSIGKTGPGTLTEPEGVAVDQASGDVYVSDRAMQRVVKYDQTGGFILTFGREVNKTKVKEREEGKTISEAEEDLCTATSGDECQSGTAGSGPSQFADPEGLAVDPTTGDLYVGDAGNNRIEKFNSSAEYISQIDSGIGTTPTFEFQSFPSIGEGANNLSVGPEGDLYIVSYFIESTSTEPEIDESVYKFEPSGAYSGFNVNLRNLRIGFDHGIGVAVGPDGSIYLVGEGRGGTYAEIRKLASRGEELLSFSLPSGNDVRLNQGDLAVDFFTGDVFAAFAVGEDGERGILQYGPQGEELSVFTTAPERASGVHDEGPLAYGTGAGMLYQVEPSAGEVAIYGTYPLPPQAVPTVEGEDWSAVGLTSVTLSAEVDPHMLATTYEIEYGTDPGLAGASSVPVSPGAVGSSFLPVSVSQELGGLSQSATYYYRVVAHNAFGGGSGSTVDGPIESFTTLAPLPSATTGEAGEVSSGAASVSGTVVPGSSGAASGTVWCFQYGTSELPGYNLGYLPGTPAGDAGQGTASVPVSARLTGLRPGTTYRYRLVAVNSLGLRQSSTACGTAGGREVDGGEGTFTTSAMSVLPVAESGGVLGISQNAATLTGTVDPSGVRTIYFFQIGTDTTYGVDLFGEAGEGSEPEPVSALISSLQPGTTYHYRLVASNANGTSYGADESFTTPTFPSSVLAAPPAPSLIGTPDIAFPADVTGGTSTKTTTPKCKQGKKLSHGKCAKPKTKKKAKKASRSRKER